MLSVSGSLSGVQSSLQSALDLVKFCLVVALPHPRFFGILILLSFTVIIPSLFIDIDIISPSLNILSQHHSSFSLSPLAPCSSSPLPAPLSDRGFPRRGMPLSSWRRKGRMGTSTPARSWRKLTRSPNCPKAFMEIVGGHDKVDVMKNCSCLLRIYLRRQIGINCILV